MKKTGLFILIIALLMFVVACSNDADAPDMSLEEENPVVEDTTDIEDRIVQVAALNGPTGMGMVKLMEENENDKTLLKYEFTLMSSPDDLVGKIINKEVDIAAVPSNLAMVLYNKTEADIQLAAINTLGVSYILENGDSIQSIEDLKGKTINVSGKGAIPDFALQYILDKNGLEIDKDVMVDFKLQHADLAAAMVEGDVEIALLPQPHVTTAMMRNEDIRIALDMTDEWKKVNSDNSELVMGVIIVQREFAENNKEMLDIFLEEYRQSVVFVNEEIDEAAQLIEKYGILPNAAIAKRAIPYSNIVYIDAQEGKESLNELYEILYNFEPKSIGGKLGDEEFYYKK
ncbi:MAG: ABC transporter substrate-binding protein [Clostridiales bacterium]|nr:ABC transporter substrate-binding protein [Clostridiales bacterium]